MDERNVLDNLVGGAESHFNGPLDLMTSSHKRLSGREFCDDVSSWDTLTSDLSLFIPSEGASVPL